MTAHQQQPYEDVERIIEFDFLRATEGKGKEKRRRDG